MEEEKIYKYILPNKDNNPIEYKEKCHSIILVGANGAGKSRLGAWIERQDCENVHRIGAQRSLKFGDYIQQRSFEQASNLMICGDEKYQPEHDRRWGWDGEKYNYTSSLLDDYEYVLSAVLALKNNEQEKYILECKQNEKSGKQHENVPEMVIDKLNRIWKSIYPHRDITIKDGKVVASLTDEMENSIEYKGKDMSDGERVVLYLIAQSLCIPKNKTIIIDEPELHIHRSIMEKLWNAIEKEREDCFFIYITHDTQFASTHRNSKKYWIKSFNGTTWEIEEVENSNLPEQLLLDILGNRKNVLFVEGTKDSYDTKIYSEIYKNYYIVPCGSCSNVILYTKSMKSNQQLHHLDCYGIIDRDYRSEHEINAHKESDIFTVNISEIDNLFLVEELLNIVNDILGYSDRQIVENIKKYIIEDRFSKQINSQICEAVVSEIKYQFTIIPISNKKEDDAKNSLEKALKEISYDKIKEEREKIYKDILKTKDYKEILKVFNCKTLSKSIGHFFCIDDKEYKEFVIRQLMGPKAKEIINAILLYLPKEIPQ